MHTKCKLHTFVARIHSLNTVRWTLDIFFSKCLKEQYERAGFDDMKRAFQRPCTWSIRKSFKFMSVCISNVYVRWSRKRKPNRVCNSQKQRVQQRINWRIRETFPLSRTILMGLLWHKLRTFSENFFLNQHFNPMVFWSSSFFRLFSSECSSGLCSVPKQILNLSFLWGHGC